MTNYEKNLRTLIVCFVLLILALVPLRFTEVKNSIIESQTQVLGDEIIIESENMVEGNVTDEIYEDENDNGDEVAVDEEVVLPNAEIDKESLENN
ncbi:MAG: hypothetical protein PHX34_02855 [Candidatus Shapirobacteria bacterium]|nr:hypothetical protein [Candidatus Shapirobacteria bacterium]